MANVSLLNGLYSLSGVMMGTRWGCRSCDSNLYHGEKGLTAEEVLNEFNKNLDY